MGTTDMPARPARPLRPRALFLGAAVGFLACCLAGRALSGRNVYKGFRRFHPYINHQTLHYPTARQLLALAQSGLAPDQVAVIIGGNSVLGGGGQGPAERWTDRLQRRLGPRYRVINFAMNGAAPAEVGGLAAEMLARRHRRVVCVTNIWAGTGSLAGLPGEDTQPFFFWDAYYKGLLADHPERDAFLAARAAARADDAYAELRRHGRLDAWLGCQDLWTAVGYRGASTVWCPLVGRAFWKPRRSFPDDDHLLGPAERYRPALEGPTLAALAHELMERCWPGTAPGAAGGDYAGCPLAQTFRICVPEALRGRTLVVVPHLSPHFTRRLAPEIQRRHEADFAETVRALGQAGFAALEVGADYSEQNYFDHCHFSAEGGARLAADVAPRVRRLAEESGYLD
jgi:lysophospholipase L1-like esterase